MGDAIVADVGLTLRALADALGEAAEREPPPPRAPAEADTSSQAARGTAPMSGSVVRRRVPPGPGRGWPG